MRKIVLASSSIYRMNLMKQIGISDVSCMAPYVDEKPLEGETAQALCLRLATDKAMHVADNPEIQTDSIVIGADQTAKIEGRPGILGKPLSHDKAFEQLKLCNGRKVTFYTGLCVVDTANRKSYRVVEPFSVEFRQLNDNQLRNYLLQEQPYDCAGSFKSEGLGITLFTRMQGEDPNTLIGLPLIKLCDILIKLGVYPLDKSPSQL